MATKKTRVTYSGMNQDVALTKWTPDLYYDANNMKLVAVDSQTQGTISNAFGNKLALSIPSPVIDASAHTITAGDQIIAFNNDEIPTMNPTSGVQRMLGHVNTRDGFMIWSTDGKGFDCVWEIPTVDDDPLQINLLYCRNLGFSIDMPIQAVFNYENAKLQKAYWVDGGNYLRYFNKEQSVENGFANNLIDLPASSVNSRSTFNINQPEVVAAGGGGIHTAGVIQYGYSLYNLNGSETVVSPLSDLFPLDKGLGQGGGNVNENVGAMPVVQITDIDSKYDFLKLYSIKYTEFNGLPSITLIYDGGVGSHDLFTFNDTGSSNLGNLGIAEFLFLGADAVKPKHIASKDNILFIANNTTTAYKLDVDTRAYSYKAGTDEAIIYNDVVYTGTGDVPYDGDNMNVGIDYDSVPEDYDCVNLDFDTYRFKANSATETGDPILTDATFSINTEDDGATIFITNGEASVTKDLTVTCGPDNVNPMYETYVLGAPYAITEDGYYQFKFDSIIERIDTQLTMEILSYRATATYTTSYGTVTTIDLDQDSITNSGECKLIGTYQVGDTIQLNIIIAYSYTNDYCTYKTIDPALSSYVSTTLTGLEGTEPSPQTWPVTIGMENYGVSEGTDIDTESFTLGESYSEGVVISNKVYPEYNGDSLWSFVMTINMYGVLPTNTELFYLGVFKNNALVGSKKVPMNAEGVISTTFNMSTYTQLGDVLDVRLMPDELYEDFTDATWKASVYGTFSINKQQASGSNEEGGSGKYVTYELTRHDDSVVDTKIDKVFKDNEIYRLGILFRNALGQETEAKWIGDFKAPFGNLSGNFNTLNVSLTDEFYAYISTLPEEDRPVNYQVLRALRTANDKTIVTQGILTGMMTQIATRDTNDYNSAGERIPANPGLLKMPQLLTRGYGKGRTVANTYYPLYPNEHNMGMGTGSYGDDRSANSDLNAEIFEDNDSDYRVQEAWQFNKMMQIQSPEATFKMDINVTGTDKLRVLGYMQRDTFEFKEQETNTQTKVVKWTSPMQFYNGEVGNFITNYRDSGTMEVMHGGFGVIGPVYRWWFTSDPPSYFDDDYENPSKLSRQLTTRKTFYPLVNDQKEYEIYGVPEVTEVGQSPKLYNKDNELRYCNTGSYVITDTKENSREKNRLDNEPGVAGVDSDGARCLTIVLGGDDMEVEDRPAIEDLFNNTTAGVNWDSEMFGEIVRGNEFVYAGVIYGGYDYYSRANTEYLPIGPTATLEQHGIDITSPGDTFVQTFVNTRLTRTPGGAYDKQRPIVIETLEYPVETVVNLLERNDISINPWGKLIDPYAEEANNYNKAYSTESTIKTYKSDSLKVNEVTQAETEVMASKLKIPGEFTESWVDFRPNEVQYLDGKLGPINALVSQWNELYTFQDTGIAKLSINPRVQVQGSDGLELELGSGAVLQDHNYITTNAGSINKWGIIPSNTGIYFTDTINKQMFRIESDQLKGVSEMKGLHAYLYNNLHKDILSIDNPIDETGISMGADSINGDIYTTVQDQKNGNFTVSFNEKTNSFTSFYDFHPTRYMIKGGKMYTVTDDNNQMWEHYDGNFQSYYGIKYPSAITLVINTDDIHAEKIFSSIEFDSQVSLDGFDVANSTIDSLQAWNDFQETDIVQLVVGKNIKRRMRTWKASIPRQKDSRIRMRDKWIYLKLGFNPSDNEKLILHDMVVSYTEIQQ